MDLPAGFERVPGRCGGRVTLAELRFEPGMLANQYNGGEHSVAEVASWYGIAPGLVQASIDLCRARPEIRQEWADRNA